MYKPKPIDTSDIILPETLMQLAELLAENTHDVWAERRMEEGWSYGTLRDDKKKEHPDLVPYKELPESEKEYDRRTAMETLKAIISFGYRIDKEDLRE